MSSPAPFNDIVARLEAAHLGYPLSLPNVPFRTPNPPTPWLRLSVVSDVLNPIELGGGVWQENGTAYVEVVVPANSGTLTARGIAKSVADVFRGVPVPADVVYLGGSIGDGTVQPVPDGIWWGLTVSIDWKYQDITQ